MATATDTPTPIDFAHAARPTEANAWELTAYARPRRFCLNDAMNAAAAPEQAWFWTTAWQAGEREVNLQFGAGDTERFDSGEAFLAALRDLAQQ